MIGIPNREVQNSGSIPIMKKVTNKISVTPPVLKNPGKVKSIVQNFESNFHVILPKPPLKPVSKTDFLDRGDGAAVKNAFQVLMSADRGGDTPKKTPGRKPKRLLRNKESPAADIRFWARKLPGGSKPPLEKLV